MMNCKDKLVSPLRGRYARMTPSGFYSYINNILISYSHKLSTVDIKSYKLE